MTAAGVYEVPSETVKGLTYKVLVGPTGAVCTCPDHTVRRRECKHIKFIREEIPEVTQQLIKIERPVAILPTPQELESMDLIATRAIDAGLIALPEALRGPDKAGVRRAVILAGWELGVKPMTAMRHMVPVEGKVEPDGQLMAAICQSRETDMQFLITEDTDQATTVQLIRPSKRLKVSYRLTVADIERAGLANKDNHRKYPRNMRRWSCIKNLCRTYCGDLINGIELSGGYMPGAVVEEPEDSVDVVEGEVISSEPTSQFFNEGDEDPEEEETGEAATDQQLATIAEWMESINEKRKAAGVVAAGNWGKNEFPHAVVNDRLQLRNLTSSQASEYIKALATYADSGKFPEKQEAFL